MENQRFYGSICLTDLINLAKEKHSAFSKAENGKIYASVNVWLNSEVDKFGNIMSVQINPTKENKDKEKRVYVGNLKRSKGPQSINDSDTSGMDNDFDIPERQKSEPVKNEANPNDETTDLPF